MSWTQRWKGPGPVVFGQIFGQKILPMLKEPHLASVPWIDQQSGRENYALFVAITWDNGKSLKSNLESKNLVEVQFKWDVKDTTKAGRF